MLTGLRHNARVYALAVLVSSLPWAASAHEEERDNDGRDPVVLTFSTVGDSRQDAVTFDPTTGPLSGQDKI